MSHHNLLCGIVKSNTTPPWNAPMNGSIVELRKSVCQSMSIHEIAVFHHHMWIITFREELMVSKLIMAYW